MVCFFFIGGITFINDILDIKNTDIQKRLRLSMTEKIEQEIKNKYYAQISITNSAFVILAFF